MTDRDQQQAAEVTERDRQAAREALTFGYRRERVAEALAAARREERERYDRLRAKVGALASDLSGPPTIAEYGEVRRAIATRLRAVLEQS